MDIYSIYEMPGVTFDNVLKFLIITVFFPKSSDVKASALTATGCSDFPIRK